MIWSLLLYHPSISRPSAVPQPTIAREKTLGRKGPSAISPRTSLKSRSQLQAFLEMCHQKSFRPPLAAAVFSMAGQASGPQESERQGKKEMCNFVIPSVSQKHVHTPRDPRGRSSIARCRLGEEHEKRGGKLPGELIFMVIAWRWPWNSNDFWIAVMKWCRSLSEFCVLTCGRKS